MSNITEPSHYKQLKGIETLSIVEQFNFCLGSSLKYILRCNHKGEKASDLKKAIYFLERELSTVEKSKLSKLK